MTNTQEITEKRRAQLRDSQRKRRQALSIGDRHQVNIYLSQKTIQTLDKNALESGLDRHQFIEKLINES